MKDSDNIIWIPLNKPSISVYAQTDRFDNFPLGLSRTNTRNYRVADI